MSNIIPDFGILIPENQLHDELYVNRKPDEEAIIELIEQLNEANIAGCLAVCGSPGCGKSTFTKYLVHRINTGIYNTNFASKRVVLDGFYNHAGRVTPIDSYSFINFSLELRELLFEHMDDELRRNLDSVDKWESDAVVENFKTKGRGYTENEFLVIKDLFKSTLIPLANCVKKSLTIFVDDIDLLPTHQLHLFVEIFSALGQPGNGIRIVFTARPVSIALVQHVVRHLLNYQIADGYHLKDISTFDLLNSRFEAVGRDLKEVLSDRCIDHVRKICCGNNERVMSEIMFPVVINHKKKQTVITDHIELHQMLAELHKIPDILSKLHKNDKIPLLYILLYCLPEPTLFDDSFVEKFNRAAMMIRGTESTEKISLSQKELQSVVARAIDYYAVRRVDFDSIETLEDIHYNRDSISHSVIALTESGLTLLRYLKHTLSLSDQILKYPIPVQQFLAKDRNFNTYSYTPENPNLFKKEWI